MEYTKTINEHIVHVLYPVQNRKNKLFAPAKVVEGGYINPFKEGEKPTLFKKQSECAKHCDAINLHNGWDRPSARLIIAASMGLYKNKEV
jgi:hypothetical protein